MKPNFNRPHLPLQIPSRRFSAGAGAAAVLCIVSAITGFFTAPSAQAAGPIRPVYVEPVLPSKPFSKVLIIQEFADGPDVGVLGITSLTIYNSGADQFISLYATHVVGPTCFSTPVEARSRLLYFIFAPNKTTLHASFPSPLVVEPIPGAANGLTCIRLVGPSASMIVNGFVN